MTDDDAAESWRDRALCRQSYPENYFPLDGERAQSRKYARRVCAGCPVQAECLEFALESDSRFGIWGGMSEAERGPLHVAAARTRRQERNGA